LLFGHGDSLAGAGELQTQRTQRTVRDAKGSARERIGGWR
jgi:hypothetical protein